MGGELPRTLDIWNPRLGTKVAIDLPALDLMDPSAASKMFSRRNIIALCARSLKPVPGWSNFVDYEKMRGRTLQLAWRAETHVDWVWIDEYTEGEQREWPVLCGVAFKNASSCKFTCHCILIRKIVTSGTCLRTSCGGTLSGCNISQKWDDSHSATSDRGLCRTHSP